MILPSDWQAGVVHTLQVIGLTRSWVIRLKVRNRELVSGGQLAIVTRGKCPNDRLTKYRLFLKLN